MTLGQRLGNFFLVVALIALFIFWADFFTSGQLESFWTLLIGVGALWLGATLRFAKRPAPPAEEDAPPPPKPAAPAPAKAAPKKAGPLAGLFQGKAKPKPPVKDPGAPAPKPKGKK
ncbi:MAG: hypothetical protein JNL09_04245 [Anaerolineales bacterium]|nr:hypothetical protein [Anaerolineales bacterium]